MRFLPPAVLLTLLAGPAAAAPPATPVDPPSAAELASIMRTLL